MLASRNRAELRDLEAALNSVKVDGFPAQLEDGVLEAKHHILDQKSALLRRLLVKGEDTPDSLQVIGTAAALGMRVTHWALSGTGRSHEFAFDAPLFREGIITATSRLVAVEASTATGYEDRLTVKGVPEALEGPIRYVGHAAATRLTSLGVISPEEDHHQFSVTSHSFALGVGLSYVGLRHIQALPLLIGSAPERFTAYMCSAIDQMTVNTSAPTGERS